MARDSRPNIVLIMTDQQRADCLGIAGHPVLQTPHLDWIGASGFHFRRAYAACPVCVPARRTLMTGRRPASHGVLMNHHTVLHGPTLPGVLRDAGYQTHLCGKKHLWPDRAHYGFEGMDWADSPTSRAGGQNDYQRHLVRAGITFAGASDAHGLGSNDWVARPWHLDEQYHFTNWVMNSAVEFLDRRDPTRPFFLNVSFLHPHQPCTPPAVYYDRYLRMDLPEPVVGDWARVFDGPRRGLYPTNTWRAALDRAVMHQIRAAYYGSINHISDQVGRLCQILPKNTIFVFCSDHGEMLGDHQWLRKRNAYEASANIPLLMRFPDAMKLPQERTIDAPVELMDIMPTVLDAVGAPVPESVEGQSLMPMLRGESDRWREYLHGECSEIPTLNSGMQYVTDGKRKYIWFPGRGQEQFFNLEEDPQEMHDLAARPQVRDEMALWRRRLIAELVGRPEGFTDGHSLLQLSGRTAAFLPGFEQPATAGVGGG